MKFIPCNYDAWDEAVDKSRRKYSRKTPTYKLSLTGKHVNVRYLMQLTNLGWKQINWLLNGLVQKGAIKKIDKYFYTI